MNFSGLGGNAGGHTGGFMGGNVGGNMGGNTGNNANPAVQNEDKVDRMLDKVEAKIAGKHGMQDPSGKLRGVNETITDKAREAIEKVTGKNVPASMSN